MTSKAVTQKSGVGSDFEGDALLLSSLLTQQAFLGFTMSFKRIHYGPDFSLPVLLQVQA